MGIDKETSHKIVKQIEQGDETDKPGWIRLSIHPTTSDEEVAYIIKAIKDLATYHQDWQKDYIFVNGHCRHRSFDDTDKLQRLVRSMFEF